MDQQCTGFRQPLAQNWLPRTRQTRLLTAQSLLGKMILPPLKPRAAGAFAKTVVQGARSTFRISSLAYHLQNGERGH
jgi:hypothetical protein